MNVNVARKYNAAIALFEGATTFGEAMAARAAILRFEAKYGVAVFVDGGTYFSAGYGTAIDHLNDAMQFASLAQGLRLYGNVGRLSPVAIQVLLAQVAILAASQPYIIGKDACRAWTKAGFDLSDDLRDLLDSVQDNVFALQPEAEEVAA